MGALEGVNREQTTFWSLDEMVGEEAMVRIVDRFIDVVDMKALGFTHMEPSELGRPRYPSCALAKLYVYGYENGIRSSRKLERETRRNVEVMWLMGDLRPDYKTISEFRRENVRPLQKLFRDFVKLCRSWELVGGELSAVDGTKVKASNNKKNNYSRKKLAERLLHLDEKIERYLAELDEADKQEAYTEKAPEGLKELLERKELYESYVARLEKTGENELSTVDPDARLMGNNRGGVEMAYNVQSAVDAKHHIILAYQVGMNPSDQGQLSHMVKRMKRMGYKRFWVVADKGYYNGADLKRVKRQRVTAIVSKQKGSDPKGQPKEFHNDKFKYDKKSDTYQCPTGQVLNPHSKKDAPRRMFFNKEACAACLNLSVCGRDKRGYRTVNRSEYGDIYEEADRNFRENLAVYKLRQQIVEHPFGTVKHGMNGGYFLLRTRRKVCCEVALLFLGYNLKRVYTVLGFRGIMDRLDAVSCAFLVFSDFGAAFFVPFGAYFRPLHFRFGIIANNWLEPCF